MASKKQLPLKGINNVLSSAIHTVEGHNYACLTLNIGSKDGLYDFVEPIFPFHAMTATGWSDGSSTWFLATVPEDEHGKLFSLEIRPNFGKTDEAATKEASNLWLKTGRLIAIDCSALPGLKILSEFLHEHKMFVKGDLKIKVSPTESDPTKLKGLIEEFFDFYRQNKRFANSSKGENVEPVMGVVGNYGVLRPVLDEPGHGLPEVDEIDSVTGLPTGEKVFQSVPFVGTLSEIEKVIFSPPQIPQRSGSGKGGSGSASVNIEGYKAQTAFEFIKSNSEEINQFFSSNYGLSGSDLALVALSLAGVPALPQFSVPKPSTRFADYMKQKLSNNEEKEIISNGHVEPEPVDTIKPLVQVTDLVTYADELRSLMKKDEKKGGLGLNDEDCDRWFELHKDSIEDVHQMLVILSSNAWKLQRKDVATYFSKLQFGAPMPSIAPTVLGSENISKLYDLIIDFDAAFAIDQNKKFSDLVSA
jgi:hypothetical protein